MANHAFIPGQHGGHHRQAIDKPALLQLKKIGCGDLSTLTGYHKGHLLTRHIPPVGSHRQFAEIEAFQLGIEPQQMMLTKTKLDMRWNLYRCNRMKQIRLRMGESIIGKIMQMQAGIDKLLRVSNPGFITNLSTLYGH